MSRFALLAALGLSLAAAPASAVAAPADDPSQPLVYAFVADALDGDRVDAGRAPFLSSLLQGNATYWKQSRSIMVAETNPNHTAMATGAFGDRSGIPGNAFAVYGDAARNACTPPSSPAPPPAGPTPEAEAAATGAPTAVDGETSACLRAETFFAAAKRQAATRRVVTAGIFGKPKLARLFSTRRVDGSAYDADHLWTPCEDDPADPPFCRSVATNPVTGYALTDALVMDEVLRSVRDGVATKDGIRRPALTWVNFPQIDSAGHATGAGPVYDAAIALFDAELQRFVEQQQALGLWERTILFVLSDHSMDSAPGLTSLSRQLDDAGLGERFTVVQNGSVDMIYLNDRQAADRHDVLKRARASILAASGVDEALYREANPADGGEAHTLDRVHPAWRLAGTRTGDIVATHGSGGAFGEPANPLLGNHGGPQTSDNTFLVVSGGGQVRRRTLDAPVLPRFDDALVNTGQAQNVDLAPTLLALQGLAPPLDSEGRVLQEALTAPVAATACRALRSPRARGTRRGGLRVTFRRAPGVGVVQVEIQRRGGPTKRFARRSSFTWSGRRARPGRYVARLVATTAAGVTEVVEVPLRRSGGRFRSAGATTRGCRLDG